MYQTSSGLSPPILGPGDRLGLMLLVALALHALVILGVSFDAAKRPRLSPPPLTMEVTLVHSRSNDAPEKADALAQASQSGGGNVEEPVRSASPLPFNPRPDEPGIGLQNRPDASPSPQPPEQTVPTLESSRSPNRTPAESPKTPTRPTPVTAAELMERSREIARLSTEIQQRQQQYARMEREKTISANTREYKYASYMDAWRMKVERIGNLNYPEEAKRQNISGTLILDVTINADGSLHGVEVLRSSGHKVLDDAAVRIVRLAAPYAPFPESFRAELDRLHIVRTWQFDSQHRLQTSGR